MLVEDVRNLWQLCAVCEFVTLFGEALRIPELNVDLLEQQLAIEDEDGEYLREVRLSLLKALSSNRSISLENMDDFIRRQYTYRRVYPNPLLRVERVWKETFVDGVPTDSAQSDESDLGEIEEIEQQTLISWLELSVAQRVGVLHDLCEWQLHSEKFRDRLGVTTDLQMCEWRISPIGVDAQQQSYYFMSDGRLYRHSEPPTPRISQQKNKKRKRGNHDHKTALNSEDDWSCVAATYEEWQSFLQSYAKTKNPDERSLLHYLKKVALPYVEEVEQAKIEKAARLQAEADKLEAERIKEALRIEMFSSRKRSSRIANLDERREQERMQQEELRKQQELEAKAHARAQKELAGTLVQPKTREARARDRELREVLTITPGRSATNTPTAPPSEIDGGDELKRENFNSAVLELQPSMAEESVLNSQPVQPPESHTVLERPEKHPPEDQPEADGASVLTNSQHQPNGDSAPLELASTDFAWVNKQASQMTQGITIAKEVPAAIQKESESCDTEANRDPTHKAEIQPLELATSDLSWVNNQASRMTQGIPLVQNHVGEQVTQHDSQPSARESGDGASSSL